MSADLLLHPKISAKRQRVLEEGRDWDVDATTGCWEWKHYRLKGYARCTNGQAHREVWRQAGRLLADEDHLHHRCKNPGCVNPAHMEPKPPILHLTEHRQEDSHLSWDDVREIRRIASEGGTSIFELAPRYGLSKSQIHNIVTNVKWHDPEYTPGRQVSCPECGTEFVATRSHQRFCSDKHRDLWNGRRSSAAYSARQKALRAA